MQWIENVIWYPTVLSFTAATIAYLIDPNLAENKIYIFSMILIVYWGCTLMDSFGMKASSMISSVGVIAGTLIPGAIIILLGISWTLIGHASHITFSWDALYPEMDGFENIVFLVGVMLGFCGIEMSAVHAKEVKNPQKDYPKAIFFSAFIILGLSVMGSLAIAIVIPSHEVSLVAGIMQALSIFFDAYGISWMTPVLAVLITIGAVAMVSTWIVGPSKGLFQTSEEGNIPPFFHKRNRYGMPIAIMIVQGLIVSTMCCAFLLMPNVSSSYWFLNVLTALLYLIMYILMFMAAIRLRYKHPEIVRTYRIPGGKTFGMWVVGGVGLVSSVFAFCIGFVPPGQLDMGSRIKFDLGLTFCISVMFLAPLIIFACRKDHWKQVIHHHDQ